MSVLSEFLGLLQNRDVQILIIMFCLLVIMTPMVIPRRVLKELFRRKRARRIARQNVQNPAPDSKDSTVRADQSETVSGTAIRAYKVLNHQEQQLFQLLSELLPQHFHPRARLLAQVSLSEFLYTEDRTTYRQIGWKRVDFLVVDPQFNPVCGIEYQGRGHTGDKVESARSSYRRDWMKRQVFDAADIPLLEIPEQYSRALLEGMLSQLSGRGRNLKAG